MRNAVAGLVFCLWCGPSMFAGDAAALPARARAVLWELTSNDESWAKIHAAEVLVAFGEAEGVRQFFLGRLPAAEAASYRIGVWRVLAATARSAEDRQQWIEKVASVAFDEGAPERVGAVETLCKLGYAPRGARLDAMRKFAREAAEIAKPMLWWSLALAGDAGAFDALADGLSSSDATTRLRAAYALRWLRPADAAVGRKLAAAAGREPPDSTAYGYVLSAAVVANADPARLDEWRTKLAHLPPEANEPNRFEAAQALLPSRTEADLAAQARLLASPGKDDRVGAAWTILHVHAKTAPR